LFLIIKLIAVFSILLNVFVSFLYAVVFAGAAGVARVAGANEANGVAGATGDKTAGVAGAKTAGVAGAKSAGVAGADGVAGVASSYKSFLCSVLLIRSNKKPINEVKSYSYNYAIQKH
jgi:hypothetical protein